MTQGTLEIADDRGVVVSVVCIFLDEERFLSQAVESVRDQTFPGWELILVDDGSNDGSSAQARDYARIDPRIRYVEHPDHENRGMSASRNLGFSRARGDLIAFIDADDVWRPQKLAEQVHLMNRHPGIGLLCGSVNYWRSWEGGTDWVVPTGYRLDTSVSPPEPVLRLYPLGAAGAPCPSDVMVRRTVIEQVGGFEEQFRTMYEDQVFFTKVFLHSRVFFSSQVWLDYRLHARSCTSLSEAEGSYARFRARYLDWLADYLERTGPPRSGAIQRSIARNRWRLAHPRAGRWWNKLRYLAERLTRSRAALSNPPALRTPDQ